MDDVNIFRSAEVKIDQYGADASIQAAKSAELLLRRRDLEGDAAWMRIGRTIEELQATEDGTRQ